MNLNRPSALALLIAALLAGCAATPPEPPKVAPVVAAAPAPPGADEVALAEGIALYNKGQYNDAIKRLGASEIIKGSKATQLAALKYSAFSYCVTNRATACRQQFDKALKLDPGFDLSAGEQGHPLWSPVFARAKKGR